MKKITVTPVFGVADEYIDGGDFQSTDLPFDLGNGVLLDDIHERMRSADFSLWAREHLSQAEVKELKQWHYALVHYFDSEEYLTSHPEENSRELVQKVFLGLRIVRPSWTPYQYLRAVVREDEGFVPAGFSKAEGRLTVSSCDAANYIRKKDAGLLREIVPSLLNAYNVDSLTVRRAIRILELGYVSEFIDVKQLIWVTALDALFTSAAHWGSDIASRRIEHFIGADTRVYELAEFPDYISVPSLTVRNAIRDIYKLRNKFAHGEWVPKEFLNKPGYFGKAGEQLNYADVLLEATGIILRMSLTRILKENLLEVFRDKDSLDWYFSRVGLVNRKPAGRGFSRREPSVH